MDLSVSSSSWGLGRAAVCDCGTPWTFLLPFFCFVLVTIYFDKMVIYLLNKVKASEFEPIILNDINIFIIGCDIYLVGKRCDLRVKYALYFILLLVIRITAYMVAVQYFNYENIVKSVYIKVT